MTIKQIHYKNTQDALHPFETRARERRTTPSDRGTASTPPLRASEPRSTGTLAPARFYEQHGRIGSTPVAVDEVAGEGGVMKREVPRPAGTALIIVQHDPAEALHVSLEKPFSSATALDVLQLALVLVVAVFPPVFP